MTLKNLFKYLKKHQGFIFFLLIISSWIMVLIFISPEEVVNNLGIEMGYLLIFITALIGISSFSSASFYATLAILASTGEFNPFILAAVAAPAAAFGDSLFFFLGLKSRVVLSQKYLIKFSEWIKCQPNWLAPVVAYLYTGFTPLPQDFLMIGMGLGKIRFRKIIIPVLLGNFTFITIISYLIAEKII